MKYLVLYKYDYQSIHSHDNPDGSISEVEQITQPLMSWREFIHKNDAMEFAHDHQGVIVEAFEWDIKKEQS